MALERRGLIELEDRVHADYWARQGWTNTIKKLHIDFDIAFLGNSITRGSDFQAAFPDKKIINLGYAGDNLIGMLRRVPMLVAANPRKIFIMAGTNDLVHVDLTEYRQNFEKLLSAISDSLPNAQIFVQSVLPSNHEMSVRKYASNKKVIEANQILRSVCEVYHYKYIDLYDLYVGRDGELMKEFTKMVYTYCQNITTSGLKRFAH